jgi:hypothetical protein
MTKKLKKVTDEYPFYVKLNYRCAKGTVDEGYSCGDAGKGGKEPSAKGSDRLAKAKEEYFKNHPEVPSADRKAAYREDSQQKSKDKAYSEKSAEQEYKPISMKGIKTDLPSDIKTQIAQRVKDSAVSELIYGKGGSTPMDNEIERAIAKNPAMKDNPKMVEEYKRVFEQALPIARASALKSWEWTPAKSERSFLDAPKPGILGPLTTGGLGISEARQALGDKLMLYGQDTPDFVYNSNSKELHVCYTDPKTLERDYDRIKSIVIDATKNTEQPVKDVVLDTGRWYRDVENSMSNQMTAYSQYARGYKKK